jgi:hypothetical protein
MGGAGAMGKAKRPINVKFEIPYFTTSGIQVRYLKITEPKVCFVLTHTSPSQRPWLTRILSAAIPLPPLGPLHYAIRRYCSPHAGRPIKQGVY